MTRSIPNTSNRSGKAALILSTIPLGSSTIFSATTCPTADTPLSVLAARVHCTFAKSPAFASDIPPARAIAPSSSPSIVRTPGFRCMPAYPAPT